MRHLRCCASTSGTNRSSSAPRNPSGDLVGTIGPSKPGRTRNLDVACVVWRSPSCRSHWGPDSDSAWRHCDPTGHRSPVCTCSASNSIGIPHQDDRQDVFLFDGIVDGVAKSRMRHFMLGPRHLIQHAVVIGQRLFSRRRRRRRRILLLSIGKPTVGLKGHSRIRSPSNTNVTLAQQRLVLFRQAGGHAHDPWFGSVQFLDFFPQGQPQDFRSGQFGKSQLPFQDVDQWFPSAFGFFIRHRGAVETPSSDGTKSEKLRLLLDSLRKVPPVTYASSATPLEGCYEN